MIEVEKKFLLSEADKSRLLEGAEFVAEKILIDVYYDDSAYSLTAKDIWMRSRNGEFELKMPLNQRMAGERVIDQYDELSDENEIKARLNLPLGKSLAQGLKEKNYVPFCTAISSRKKYKNGSFFIDLDEVSYPDAKFNYSIAEIEIMVQKESEIESAGKSILAFALQKNLKNSPVRGKIIEYLKQKKPLHYAALIRAKVVKEF